MINRGRRARVVELGQLEILGSGDLHVAGIAGHGAHGSATFLEQAGIVALERQGADVARPRTLVVRDPRGRRVQRRRSGVGQRLRVRRPAQSVDRVIDGPNRPRLAAIERYDVDAFAVAAVTHKRQTAAVRRYPRHTIVPALGERGRLVTEARAPNGRAHLIGRLVVRRKHVEDAAIDGRLRIAREREPEDIAWDQRSTRHRAKTSAIALKSACASRF